MHNFIGLNLKHDNFRKGLFFDGYDEPTYLTFAIDFKFESVPVRDESALDSMLWNSPLFANPEVTDSAINFLISRGYNPQADGLATFRELLRYLTFQAPWYFQSILGLTKLWESATDVSRGHKGMEGQNKIKLEITTLEAVDLRMTEIADLYRNAIFDKVHRRERVPDNLRWFSMDIYLAEFRNIRYRLPGASTQQVANALGVDTGAIGNIVGGGNSVSNILDQFGYIKFKCRQCEFDFSQSLPVQQTVQIGGTNRQAETNKFAIKIGYFEEENKFGDNTMTYDSAMRTSISNPWGSRNLGAGLQNTGSFLSGLPGIGDNLAKAGEKVANGLAQIGGLINPALEAASNFVDPNVTNLGQVNQFGYASNGDIVPKKQNPSSGKAN